MRKAKKAFFTRHRVCRMALVALAGGMGTIHIVSELVSFHYIAALVGGAYILEAIIHLIDRDEPPSGSATATAD